MRGGVKPEKIALLNQLVCTEHVMRSCDWNWEFDECSDETDQSSCARGRIENWAKLTNSARLKQNSTLWYLYNERAMMPRGARYSCKDVRRETLKWASYLPSHLFISKVGLKKTKQWRCWCKCWTQTISSFNGQLLWVSNIWDHKRDGINIQVKALGTWLYTTV